MKIRWSPEAKADADEYARKIADENPLAAAKWYEKLIEFSETAQKFPRSGVVVPEFDNENFRQFIVSSHRLIYRKHKGFIEIVRVWHGARLLTETDIGEP